MSKKLTPFQSLYRLTVMLGVLVVGSMAAYRYGPPPERLASMIDSGVARIGEMRERFSESRQPRTETPHKPFVATMAATEPAPAWPSAQASPPAAPRPQAKPGGVVIEPFGESGRVYRATGSAAGPGGLVRRFDAIASTPEQAELAVLNKMGAAGRGG